MTNFDRQYRLSAGQAGKPTGFEVGATTPESPIALHISFSIEKADTETPNTSKISVWNISKEHLNILNEKDCLVTLRAGYGNHMPLIFVGTITNIVTSLDGADRETEIEAADGRVPLRDTFLALSYNGVVLNKQVIDDIAVQMGVTLTYSYNAQFVDFPNGFSFTGPARTALDKACASSGLSWQIQNGVLQVKMQRDTMSREVYLLSPDTGLIEIPKKITISADDEGAGDMPGLEVRYFLNGAINIGDYIRLESKVAQGYFRVHSVAMDGDNLEGDWLCTAQLLQA